MKLCLIGSSRFKEIYDRANRELTLMGHVVYSIATVSTGDQLPEKDKTILDLVHLRKIQESETSVLVTDDTGYYGFSTRREMMWGVMIGKPLAVFVTRDPETSILCLLGGMFGMRTIDSIPDAQAIAEIIYKTRLGPDQEFGIPQGEA